MISTRKPPMSSLIREHQAVVRRMELGAAGAVFLEAEPDQPSVRERGERNTPCPHCPRVLRGAMRLRHHLEQAHGVTE